MTKPKTDDKPSCNWCGRKITEVTISRCRECDLPVCSPYLRSCAYDHWRERHLSGPRRRKVATVRSKKGSV